MFGKVTHFSLVPLKAATLSVSLGFSEHKPTLLETAVGTWMPAHPPKRQFCWDFCLLPALPHLDITPLLSLKPPHYLLYALSWKITISSYVWCDLCLSSHSLYSCSGGNSAGRCSHVDYHGKSPVALHGLRQVGTKDLYHPSS